MADDVDVVIGGDATEGINSLNQLRFAIQGLSNPIRGVRDSLGELAEAFVAGFAVEKIVEFAERMEDLGVQTQRAAALLGVSTQSVAGLDIAAKASGGSLDELTHGMERLGLTIARAGADSQQAVAALRALGINAKEFSALPTSDKLEELADRFSVLRDGVEKDAIAIALLGRAGADMIPTLNQGRQAFEEFNAMAERAGSQATPQFIATAKEMHETTLEMDQAFRGVGMTLTTVFGPAFAGLEQVIVDVVEAFNDSIRQGGAMSVLFDALAVAARALATALVIAVAAVETLWEVTKTAVFAMGESFMGLGRIIKDAFTFNFGDIGLAWQNLQDQLSARAKITADNMQTIFSKSTGELKKIWQDAADTQVKIEQTKNAQLAIVNANAVSAQMKAVEEEVKLVQEGLKQKTLVLDEEVKTYQITQNEKFGALEKFTEDAYQQELALLEKERDIGGMTVAQQQEVDNKIRQLKAQHETEMIKLDQQSVQAQLAIWKQYTDTIASSFNSGLRGIITGTESWKQALGNLLLDLSLKMIELLVTKPVTEYIAGQLAMLTATQSGAAARAATEVASTATSLPARAGKFVSDITADAAEVFAGIFANMAPLLGPAAAGPAAAGQATVLAQLANVPKFDVGSWSVPRTGLAVVHQNEFIAPAGAPADAARSAFTGGGGAQISFQISAWDAQSVQQWLSRGGATQIARAVRNASGMNPSLRPAT